MDKIKLAWIELIRVRMREERWAKDPTIYQFIKPIIEFGEDEEERITQDFNKILGETHGNIDEE